MATHVYCNADCKYKVAKADGDCCGIGFINLHTDGDCAGQPSMECTAYKEDDSKSMKVEVTCGTQHFEKIKFDIEEYGIRSQTSANDDQVKRAVVLLTDTMDDLSFIDDGCRNEDAVNSCIALHMLGFDPVEWFNNWFDTHNKNSKFYSTDIDKFMEHVERVCKYLSKWGPEGREGFAFNYVI